MVGGGPEACRTMRPHSEPVWRHRLGPMRDASWAAWPFFQKEPIVTKYCQTRVFLEVLVRLKGKMSIETKSPCGTSGKGVVFPSLSSQNFFLRPYTSCSGGRSLCSNTRHWLIPFVFLEANKKEVSLFLGNLAGL